MYIHNYTYWFICRCVYIYIHMWISGVLIINKLNVNLKESMWIHLDESSNATTNHASLMMFYEARYSKWLHQELFWIEFLYWNFDNVIIYFYTRMMELSYDPIWNYFTHWDLLNFWRWEIVDDLRWFPPISPWSRRRRPLASNPVAYQRRLRKTIGFDRGLRGRFGIYLVAHPT